MERHRFAPAEGRYERQGDGRVHPRHEAQAVAVAAEPALEHRRVLHRDHDVRRARRVAGQEASRQVPVADVGGERDHRPLQPAKMPDSRRGPDVSQEPSGRLEQVAEAHGELAEYLGGDLLEPPARRPRHQAESLPDHSPLGRHDPRRQEAHPSGQPEPRVAREPRHRRGEPIDFRAVIGVGVPPRSCGTRRDLARCRARRIMVAQVSHQELSLGEFTTFSGRQSRTVAAGRG